VRVVFLHHHLRQGGVTRVIEEQINAIGDVHEVLVITGEAPSGPAPYAVEVIPSLSYDRDRREKTVSSETALEILDRVGSFWGGEADLFHVHNPTLGKNRDFIGVIKGLQSNGARLLLQIHDFAEDGRPQNYTGESYPENCHYAAINSRDYNILKRAGLSDRGLHLIPNAVRSLPVSNHGYKQDLILYPVRAIRRKNIGEALLLSLFITEGRRIAVTLEPTGALDVRSYTSWKSFSGMERLPLLFGLGKTEQFEQLLARARCIVTTSIKEGFGLAFLESWMGNRPLVGRLLPDICDDFLQKGLRLNHLYTKLSIPLKLFNFGRFCEKWEHCYRQRLDLYGLEIDEKVPHDYLKGVRMRGSVDFGELSEDLQMEVIDAVKGSSHERDVLIELNPFLRKGCDAGEWSGLIAHNREIIAREYSVQRNRERLLNIYDKACSFTPRQRIRGEELLHIFNTPEANHLLLCDQSYDG
jgi:glycosyltransferase involved in cell wall biosynthesis